MTLDEAIKHCLEVAEENDCKAMEYNEHDEWEFVNKCNCEQCAADHRQLAEWLTELQELRNSIGAVKLADMKEAVKLMSELDEENSRLISQLTEYKWLLKAAVEDMTEEADCGICLHDNDGECPTATGVCNFKWRYADEAEKLLNEEI